MSDRAITYHAIYVRGDRIAQERVTIPYPGAPHGEWEQRDTGRTWPNTPEGREAAKAATGPIEAGGDR